MVEKPAVTGRHGEDDERLFADLIAEEVGTEPVEPPGDWRVEDWFGFALFWALAGIVFLQFFSRYVLNDSVAWTEEIARYVLMAMAFVGCALAARRGTHIAVEVLLYALPRGTRRWVRGAVNLVSSLFLAALTVLCWQVADAMRFQPMVVVDLPMAIVYGAVFVGLAATTVRFALHAVKQFREGEPETAPDPSLEARL
jgi:TRAP-type C4-dicarboxylate transport system permease small subunit